MKVKGKFNSDNRVLHLTDIVKRHLFVQMKGDLMCPDMGFFFELSAAEKHRLGMQYVVVLLPDANIFYEHGNEEMELEMLPLLPDDPFVFYVPDNTGRSAYYKSFFTNPGVEEPVPDVGDYHNLLHTKEWIAHLNDKTQVRVAGKMYAMYTNGECHGTTTYIPMALANLAKQQLQYVADLFPEIDAEHWTQREWTTWYSQTMRYKKLPLAACNAQNWNEAIHFKEAYGNSAMFTTDAATGKIYRTERVPYVEDFSDQQVMVFDMKGGETFKRKIYDPTQQKINSIIAIQAMNDTLFMLSQNLKWQKYEPGPDNADAQRLYHFIEEKSVVPAELTTKKGWYHVLNTYSNSKVMYCTFSRDENQLDVYLLALETSTGKVLAIKPLKEILAAANINSYAKVEAVSINYGSKAADDYVFAFKTSDRIVLFKTDKDLRLLGSAAVSNDFQYQTTVFEDSGRNKLTHVDRGVLTIADIDWAGHSIANQITLPILPDEDDAPLIAQDGTSLRIIAKYQSPFEQGIKCIVVAADHKTMRESCVFNYVPVSEDSELKLHYLTKASKGWTVFFKKDEVLRFAIVAE